jgi:hypothetical protein
VRSPASVRPSLGFAMENGGRDLAEKTPWGDAAIGEVIITYG